MYLMSLASLAKAPFALVDEVRFSVFFLGTFAAR